MDLLLENKDHFLMIEVKLSSYDDYENFKVSPLQKMRLENSFLYLSQYLEKPLEIQYVVVSRSGEINAYDAF